MNTGDSRSVIASYDALSSRIEAAARAAGRRASELGLVAVSKGQPASVMRRLAEQLHGRGREIVFGESYVQEYRAKRGELPAHRAHFIGRLQRNKARDLVALFDVIESVPSAEAAEALNAAAERAGKRQDVLLQVNVSADRAKAGFAPLQVVPFIAEGLPRLAALRLCGLMAITRLFADAEGARPDFRAMAGLAREVRTHPGCAPLIASDFHLSMGMSADFEIAVQEGATLVRVGTALFGERRK